MNKMRYFRKRINRGIVLGILLLVSVILFTVISNTTFKNVEKGRIKALTENYISDYSAMLSDHLGKPLGTAATAEETGRMACDFSEFAGKYFVYRNNAFGEGLGGNAKNIEEIETEYRDNLAANIGNCQLFSLSLSPQAEYDGIVVKKAGPKNATVVVSLTGNGELCGNPLGIYFPGAYAYAQTIGEFYLDDNGNLVPVTPLTPDDTTLKYSCMGSASLFLEKIDGEWKIAYVTYAYLNFDTAVAGKGE